MNQKVHKYGLVTIKALVALAFTGAGLAKLSGVSMMVETFDAIGVGQWFRYVTALIEITGAALLFVPGRQAWGAGLLMMTMIGAVTAHFLVLGPSVIPASILGGLSALILYSYRDQLRVG